MLSGVDAEGLHLFGVGRYGDEVACHVALRPARPSRNHSRAVWALVMVSWVVKVLEAIDEERRLRVEPLQRLGDVRAVHVRDEMDARALPARTA